MSITEADAVWESLRLCGYFVIKGFVCSEQQQQQHKSPVEMRLWWWWQLKSSRLKGWWICKDWVVMGRWSGVHNSSMNKLKAEIGSHLKGAVARWFANNKGLSLCYWMNETNWCRCQISELTAPDNESRNWIIELNQGGQCYCVFDFEIVV